MWASMSFRYAIATGEPTTILRHPFEEPFEAPEGRDFAALTKAEEFGQLLGKVHAYDGSPIKRVQHCN